MGLWDLIAGSHPSAAVGAVANQTVGGIFDGIKGLISEFHLSPEQELQAKLKLGELQLQTMQASVQDTMSARQMQMTTKSRWPGLLSTIILSGYFVVLYTIFNYGLPSMQTSQGTILLMLIQTLNVAVGMVLQFWLGSSSGSQNKDWMLYKSTPNGNGK